MSPTSSDDYSYDERQMPAEYRTDSEHIQVLKLEVGKYMIRERRREHDAQTGRYDDWSGWNIIQVNLPLIDAMWEFARIVIVQASTAEYAWGMQWRKMKVEFDTGPIDEFED
jgi:hypothetical protein